MIVDLGALLAALGGGALGAALGALPAFIFTGVMVLIGVAIAASGGGNVFLTEIAFGSAFGPHISFAGGAAAAAYAGRSGQLENGRDITVGLMGADSPALLLVGAIFGAAGYLCNALLQTIGFAPWTDTIALTVFGSGICARLLFGRTGLFGQAPHGVSRFQPIPGADWLPWQQRFPQVVTIGLAFGLVSAFGAQVLKPEGGGAVVGFGIAASLIIFVQMGVQAPVMHHIALPAAAAASVSGSLALGAAAGAMGALTGELLSRLFLIHGDTHVDPPAGAIAVTITMIRITQALS